MKTFSLDNKISIRDSESVATYLHEIAKHPLLTTSEENQLTKEVRNGNVNALHSLVKSNLKFVVLVAKQFHETGLPFEDLINEGNIGLINAAKRFDNTTLVPIELALRLYIH